MIFNTDSVTQMRFSTVKMMRTIVQIFIYSICHILYEVRPIDKQIIAIRLRLECYKFML